MATLIRILLITSAILVTLAGASRTLGDKHPIDRAANMSIFVCSFEAKVGVDFPVVVVAHNKGPKSMKILNVSQVVDGNYVVPDSPDISKLSVDEDAGSVRRVMLRLTSPQGIKKPSPRTGHQEFKGVVVMAGAEYLTKLSIGGEQLAAGDYGAVAELYDGAELIASSSKVVLRCKE